MVRYTVNRLLQGLVVLLLVSIGTFVILHLLPGDPISLFLGEGQVQLSKEQEEAIRHSWGLDKSLPEQYITWILNMLTGNFGQSIIRQGVSVSQMIFEAAGVTVLLNLCALAIALVLAIPAGIVAGARRNSPFDYFLTVGATLGVSLPSFWVGLMLIIIFALVLKWLPPYGITTWQGYILPVAVLATEQTALFARVMRSTTIEALAQDYVRTARSKGLVNRVVLLRHAVRNALLPVISVVGYQLALLLSGTIIIETVFALPGIGRLFVDSVFRYDYQVVQAIVLVISVIVVLVNIMTDLVYSTIDPRIHLK